VFVAAARPTLSVNRQLGHSFKTPKVPCDCHTNMLSPVHLSLACPSVCLSSVTLVRPTQAVQNFGNISTALCTLASTDIHCKFHGDRRMATPPPGELNTRGVAKYSDFGPIDGAISRKRCKIGSKLVLTTNRKSYMSFRFVQKSVTLNNLERRNGVILRYFSEFG